MCENKDKSREKIGSRILSDHELAILLPDYEQILKQLEKVRSGAEQYRKEGNKNRQKDREFDKHHNNVFSILGERGSGKTSVLLTMKYKILNGKETKDDVLLPIIVPEDMGKNSEVLAWLIGYLGEISNDIQKKLKPIFWGENDDRREKYFPNCIFNKKNNPLAKKYRELQKAYLMRSAQYKEIIKNEFVNADIYIDESTEALDADKRLSIRFEDFLNELIDCSYLINLEKEPLLIVFFDDVDISSERCIEVLSIVMRYLSYRNIVVFLAGNYQNFAENITIDYLKKDGILASGLLDKAYYDIGLDGIASSKNDTNALTIRQQLSYDYLKKVLSPVFRYTMPKLNEQQKAHFIYTTEKDHSKEIIKEKRENESLFKLLENLYFTYNGRTDKSFLEYKGFSDDEGSDIILPYFRIFDDTPRGIINVYYLLMQLKQQDDKDHINTIQRLLDTIVDSSSVYTSYKNVIGKVVNIKKDYYIDYEYLQNSFNQYRQKKHDNVNEFLRKREDFISIFILAHFMDNILDFLRESKNKASIDKHGALVFWEILSSINDKIAFYPKIADVSLLLLMNDLLSKRLSREGQLSLATMQGAHYSLQKYFEVLTQLVDKKNNFFQDTYKYDEKWTEQIIDNIYKHSRLDYSSMQDSIEMVMGRNTVVNYDDYTIKIFQQDYDKIYSEVFSSNRGNEERSVSKLIELIKEDYNKKYNIKNLYKTNGITKYSDMIHYYLNIWKYKQYYEGLVDLYILHENISRNNIGRRIYDSKLSLLEIRNIIERVNKRIRVLEVRVSDTENKECWEYATEDDKINYISHREKYDEKAFGDEDDKIEFGIKEYCEANLLEITDIISEEKLANGILIFEKNLSKVIKEKLISYFRNLEEYEFLKNFVLPILNYLLDDKNDNFPQRLQNSETFQYIYQIETESAKFVFEDFIKDKNLITQIINKHKIVLAYLQTTNNEKISRRMKRMEDIEDIEELAEILESARKTLEHEIESVAKNNNLVITTEGLHSLYIIKEAVNNLYIESLVEKYLNKAENIIRKEDLDKIVNKVTKYLNNRLPASRRKRLESALYTLKQEYKGKLLIDSRREAYRLEISYEQLQMILESLVIIKTLQLFLKRKNDDFYKVAKELSNKLEEKNSNYHSGLNRYLSMKKNDIGIKFHG